MDEEKLCRICLKPCSSLYSLFTRIEVENQNRTVKSVLDLCANMQVKQNDNYPKSICKNCLKKLAIAFRLRTLVTETEHKLPELFNGERNCVSLQNIKQEPPDTFQFVVEKGGGGGEYVQTAKILSFKRPIKKEIQSEFKRRRLLRAKLKNPPRGYYCAICSTQYPSKKRMYLHLRRHRDARPYVCCVCLKTFSKPRTLNRHIKNHRGVKMYECSSSTKKVSKWYYIKVPKGFKKDKRTCPHCREEFKSRKLLKQHEEQHMSELQNNFSTIL